MFGTIEEAEATESLRLALAAVVRERLAPYGCKSRLAVATGHSRSTINGWMQGNRGLLIPENLAGVARFLETTPEALLEEARHRAGVQNGHLSGGDTVVSPRQGLSTGVLSPIPLGPERGRAGHGTTGGPTAAPLHVYPGYALGERVDPRDHATWPAALGERRRRALDVGDGSASRVGTTGDEFAILVTDSTLSHVETDGGVVSAGWTCFVNTSDTALVHAPARVVVGMSRAGELVAGYLSRDAGSDDDGWLLEDAHVRHPVAPGDLLGAVVLFDPPRYATSRRRMSIPTP